MYFFFFIFLGNNENSNIFAIIDNERMNIQIYAPVWIDHKWMFEYICLWIFRQMNIFAYEYLDEWIYSSKYIRISKYSSHTATAADAVSAVAAWKR